MRCQTGARGMSDPEISSRLVTSVVLRYGLAVVSVAIALGLALLAQVYAVHNPEFPLFLIAIAVTVWYAGAWPGALAVVLSSASFNYFFTEPLYTFYIAPSDRLLRCWPGGAAAD
jgi:K+-sensing histidine kinase KdpD